MPTRLQSSSASDRMCELKSTVRPSSRKPRISSRTSRRPIGSRPDIGSSRMTSSGSLTSACASPTRWTMPFEYCAQRPAPIGAEADPIEHARARARRGLAAGSRRGRQSTPAALRRSGGRRTSGSRAGTRAGCARRRRPADGRALPRGPTSAGAGSSSSLSVVLLPAPLGPSRPKTPPGGNLERQPSSARCGRGRQNPVEKSLVRRSVRTTVDMRGYFGRAAGALPA